MRRIAILLAATLVGLMLMLAVPASGTDNSNDPAYWGEDCWKDDNGRDTDTFVADADYRLVVLKAGTNEYVFENVSKGDTLVTGSGQDISHIIFCEGSDSSTTTTTTTSSTVPPTSTTTAPSTTTTTEPPSSSTTTTTVPSTTSTSTTTTTQPSTTTSTSPSTTTTAPASTTTEEGSSNSVVVSTLPYTGVRENLIAGGLLVLATGGVLIALTWRTKEE